MNTMDTMPLDERIRLLMIRAQTEFGEARAGELEPEIRRMAEELQRLHATPLDTDNEP